MTTTIRNVSYHIKLDSIIKMVIFYKQINMALYYNTYIPI